MYLIHIQMNFFRILLIAAFTITLIKPMATLRRSDRRDCTPGSADPECSSAVVFDDFFHPAKKQRRSNYRQNSNNSKNKRKFENWPDFHPPLKSTRGYIPTTTVAVVAETTVNQRGPWLPIPPQIPFLRKISHQTGTSNINSTFLNLSTLNQMSTSRKQKNTLIKSSLPFSNKSKVLQTTPIFTINKVYVHEKSTTKKVYVSNRLEEIKEMNQSRKMPWPLPSKETARGIKVKPAGNLNIKIKQPRIENNSLSTMKVTTDTFGNSDLEKESTSSLPMMSKTDSTLLSTFHVIRSPKRVNSTPRKIEEIKSTSDLFKMKTTQTKSLKPGLQTPALQNRQHEYVYQPLKHTGPSTYTATFYIRTATSDLMQNERTRHNLEQDDMQNNVKATIESTTQTVTSLPASSEEKLKIGNVKTDAVDDNKIPTVTETTLSQTSENTDGILPSTKGIFKLQTILPTKTPVTNSNLSDDIQVEKNSHITNCDQFSKTKTHQRSNKILLNVTNRTYHTTTLSVKIKPPQEDWTISDNRASAVGIGSLGIIVIIAIIGGVICLDAATLYRDAKRIRKKFYKIFRPMKASNKDAPVSNRLPKWAHFVTTRES